MREPEPWGPRDIWQCTSVDERGWACVLGASHTVEHFYQPQLKETDV